MEERRRVMEEKARVMEERASIYLAVHTVLYCFRLTYFRDGEEVQLQHRLHEHLQSSTSC